MISLVVDGQEIEVNSGASILDACKNVGTLVPRFCYHDLLSIAGNCRMCLVEVEGIEKPVASCLTEVADNMVVYTNSIFAKKARENVLEILLVNHPLDCPICDQAGECDLQDQTKMFGSNFSKFSYNKRGVEDKDCGPLIKTIMTRCIHCTRCVRYSSEIAGVDILGTFNRGSATEIGGYSTNFFDSEISGNVIDLCPVGALTSKPFAFKVRPWELRSVESIDITDSIGSNIYIQHKDWDIHRILPKNNENINGQIISDIGRFSYDASNINRLRHIYPFGVNKDTNSISWTKFFKQIDKLNIQENATLFVNEDIGLNNLSLLKKLSQMKKNINIQNLSLKREDINFYNWNLVDKINDINSCNSFGMVFFTNPRVECASLNAKLRMKVSSSLLSFATVSLYYNSNFSNKSIFLNTSKALNIFEGKESYLSKSLSYTQSPLVILGESIKKYGLSIFYTINYLKSIFNTLKVLKINISANSESLEMLNINYFIKNKFKNSKSALCVNLDNSLKVRKFFFNFKKDIFWFNSHRPIINRKIRMRIPILSSYEEESIFLNLEQRPQKTGKVFNKYFDSRNVSKIFISMFSDLSNPKAKSFSSHITNSSSNVASYLEYLIEISSNLWLFENLQKNYSLLILKSDFNIINYYQLLPWKSYLSSDFFDNKNVNHSLILRELKSYKHNAV